MRGVSYRAQYRHPNYILCAPCLSPAKQPATFYPPGKLHLVWLYPKISPQTAVRLSSHTEIPALQGNDEIHLLVIDNSLQ